MISEGVVHKVPDDLKKIITADKKLIAAWEAITPLARNEWLCWFEDAKKPETRLKRIERMRADLLQGKNRPCCWAGCNHR